MEWKKGIHRWRLENNGKKITKDVFAMILETTLNKMSNFADVVRNGFKTCGLIPFCADNIKFSKYFKDKDKAGGSQDTSEQQREREDKQKGQGSVLEILEEEIPSEILVSFKQSGEIWEGAIEHTSLFMIWKKVIARTEFDNRKNNFNEKSNVIEIENDSNLDRSDLINTMNGQKENIDDLDITGLINVGNLSLPIIFDFTNDLQLESPLPLIPNTRNSPIKNLEDTGDKERDQINELLTSKISNVSIGNIEENDDNERDQTYRNIPNVPSENMEKNDDDVQEQTYGSIGRHSTPVKSLIIPPMMTPEQNQTGARPPLIAMNFSQDKNSSCIPTPFKKSLFWPESKTEKETRKQREKIPAVTTSLQWQQYFEKKGRKEKARRRTKTEKKIRT